MEGKDRERRIVERKHQKFKRRNDIAREKERRRNVMIEGMGGRGKGMRWQG